MSSLFGSTKAQPAPEAKALGIDQTRQATSEQAQPLPVIFGTRPVAIQWLADVIDQRAEEVTDEQDVGKGDGESYVVGYDYFATIAGVFCHGEVTELREVWIDDERVWQGTVSGGSPAVITLEGRGEMRFYFGTEDQDVDEHLDGHPAYRGQAYAVFPDFYFGRDRLTAPNVEVVVEVKPKTFGFATPALVNDSDANPVLCMLTLLSNERYGLGLGSANFDLAQIENVADQLQSEGIGISPLITETAAARSLMIRFCEYFDGFLSFRGDNKLRIELARNPATDTSIYPLLGEYDLTEPPEIVEEGWHDTVNQVACRFSNRKQRCQPQTETWFDLANRQIQGEPVLLQIDRSWVCSRAIAHRLAERTGRLQSVPSLTGRFKVRKAAALTISVGGFVRLSWQDYDTTIVWRVVSIRVPDDRSQVVEIEAFTDRYFDAIEEYQPDDLPEPEQELLEAHPVAYGRVVELPKPLVSISGDRKGDIYVAAIAARSTKNETRIAVYASEDGGSYLKVGEQRSWAFYGTLAAEYGETLILDESGDGMLLDVGGADLIFPSTTDKGWIRERLLIFVGGEIMAYKTATIVSPTQVRLTSIRRGVAATETAVHAYGTPVLVIARNAIKALTLSEWERGDEVYFKLATTTAVARQPLDEVVPVTLTLTDREDRPAPPLNLRVNGDYLTPTFHAGDNISIRWDSGLWHRTSFWRLWDTRWEDEKLRHTVQILNLAGDVKRSIKVAVGNESVTYSAGDRTADFGAEPSEFVVRVFGRRRGLKSERFVSLHVTLV